MSETYHWCRWMILGGVAVILAVLPAAARPRPMERAPDYQVQVAYGDSLWTLAREHVGPRYDVREVVAEMMKVNQVSPSTLRAGQVLVIPSRFVSEGRLGR